MPLAAVQRDGREEHLLDVTERAASDTACPGLVGALTTSGLRGPMHQTHLRSLHSVGSGFQPAILEANLGKSSTARLSSR